MNAAGICLMSDDDLIRNYSRAILDKEWLRQMALLCTEDKATGRKEDKIAGKHFMDRFYKEGKDVEALELEILKRGISLDRK